MSTDDDLRRRLRAGSDAALAGAPIDPVAELHRAKARGRRRRTVTRVAGIGSAIAVVTVIGLATLLPTVDGDDRVLRTADTSPVSSVVPIPEPGAPSVPNPGGTAPAAALVAGTWRPIAASPLSPRQSAVTVWTGTEVLVLGGNANRCAGSTDCPLSEPSLTDGAAYDPSTDRWRTLAPAPSSPDGRAVLVGDTVFVGSSTSPLLAYDIGEDSWSLVAPTFADPTELRAPLIPAGELDGKLLLVSDPGVPVQLVLLDPATSAAEEIPTPPIPALSETTAVVVDGRVFLLGPELIEVPASERPPALVGAVLERGTWRRLPDGSSIGGASLVAAGGMLVDPSSGAANGGGGGDGSWGGWYPYGAMLDLATETWYDLPPDRPASPWASGFPAIPAGDQVLSVDGLLLDPRSGTWTVVPAPPGPADQTAAAVAWAGDRIFVWGGRSAAAGTGQLIGTGATLVPG